MFTRYIGFEKQLEYVLSHTFCELGIGFYQVNRVSSEKLYCCSFVERFIMNYVGKPDYDLCTCIF